MSAASPQVTQVHVPVLGDLRVLYRAVRRLDRAAGLEEEFLAEFGSEHAFMAQFKRQPYDRVSNMKIQSNQVKEIVANGE